MNYQDKYSAEKSEILINKRFLYIFIACTVVSHFLHEISHYFVTIIQGGVFIMYYLSWEVITPLADTSILMITFTGPIITIILAYSGIFLAEKTEKYKQFGISFAFSNSMMKMLEYVPNLLNIYKGGDEYQIAQILGINEKVIYYFFFLIFLPPFLYIILKIGKGYFQRIKRILIITFVVFMYIGIGFLLDRIIMSNPKLFIFRSVLGLSLPFLIIGITSMILLFILLYQNSKKIMNQK